MTFFITGGAGFLGINLVRHLLQKGDSVISYDLAPFDYPEKSKITAVTGDIRDFEKLKSAMQGADVVIHAAAALPLYSADDIRSTDIDGTKNTLEAALQNGIKRVVHVSSTAVYGIPDHHPLREEDALDGVGEYGKAKIAAEELCLEYRRTGLVVPIVRPKSFVGPERLGVFALLYDWAADGKNFPMIGKGDNRYQLLDVEDLCEAIYLCATLPGERANDTFNIGAKKFTTMKEDYHAVLDRAGFGRRIIGLPAAPVILALRFLEALNLSPLYKWVYETAGKDSFVSIEKAQRLLRWEPKFSNKDALVRNYEWYLAHRQEFKEHSGVSHRVPWKQGILALAKPLFGVRLPHMLREGKRIGEMSMTRFHTLLLCLLLGLFLGVVLALQLFLPHAYLAADSFTYFTTVKHFWESNILLSYSGVDHTTGVHLGWYFLLLPFFPLFGMALPEGSFIIGLLLTLAGVWLLRQSFGSTVAVVMLLFLTTTWGVRTINNGMESVLVFFTLCVFAYACVRYEALFFSGAPQKKLALWAATAGAAAGLVAFARLDCALIFLSLGAVLSLHTLLRGRGLRDVLTSGLYNLVPLAAGFFTFFLPTLAILYIYGGSIMPIAGLIKSTFPHMLTAQDLPTFRKFPVAVAALGVYLLYRYFKDHRLGILMPTLLLATVGLYIYNFFFVIGVGVWYSAVPFFAAVLVLGLVVRDVRLPAFFERHFGRVTLAIVSLFITLALLQHLMHPYLSSQRDRIEPVVAAAARLSEIAAEGEAAAETFDGVFSFYSSMPVYSLTGLGNNREYYDAVVERALPQYFSERSIKYMVGGGGGIAVPAHAGYRGHATDPVFCSKPFLEMPPIAFYLVEDCFGK